MDAMHHGLSRKLITSFRASTMRAYFFPFQVSRLFVFFRIIISRKVLQCTYVPYVTRIE